jgi:hypothetical protein
MTFLIPFIGVSYRLILTWQRARNAYITVMEEGLTFVDHHGVARHYCWEEVLAVSEIRREWSGFFPSAQAIRAAVSPAALQVRTPWGYFEIDASLEKYEALRNLIEQVIAAREAPPAYPATLLAPSDAALSRARPGGTEVPTERALSRAVAPEEEKPRLTGEVEEEAKVEQK